MKQSFCGKQRRQREWNDFSTSSYYTLSRRTIKLNFETRESQMTFLLSTIYPSALVIISLPTTTFHLSCENIRFSSLLVAGDVSRGGKNPAPQRRRARKKRMFHCMFTWLPSLLCTSFAGGLAMHWLSFYLGNFRETWTRNFNPRDALFLLFNFRDSCVGPALYPRHIRRM